jgi:lipid II:glycine glycyltransferase (peptidoglycan interpeptide bridge formation enzyme)
LIAQIIQPDDPRWRDLLNRTRHDFYHLPEYVAFASQHDGGKPCAFYAEINSHVLLAPLVLRSIPEDLAKPGWMDATCPYGYPSLLVTPSTDEASIDAALKALCELGTQRNIVSAFFRLHPLIEIPHAPLLRNGSLVYHGQTVHVDLTLPREQIWAQIRHDQREDINKLRRLDYAVVIDDWSYLPHFGEVYRETMRRVSADNYYYFSDEYFVELRAALESRLHLCTVLSPEGELASAGLFTATEGIVQGHLAGTSERYFHMAPSKLVIFAEIEWGKAAGQSVYHLGGGVGARKDNLFNFKAGFSKLRSEFYTYRMVLDHDKYSSLMSEVSGCVPGRDSDFFPPYRRPLTEAQESNNNKATYSQA